MAMSADVLLNHMIVRDRPAEERAAYARWFRDFYDLLSFEEKLLPQGAWLDVRMWNRTDGVVHRAEIYSW